MPKKKEDKIYSILASLDDTLKRQNSTRRVFVQGIVRGLGTALGATVLLALATSITIKLSNTVDLQSLSEVFFNAAVED